MPKDKPLKRLRLIKNREIKIWNQELETRTVLVSKDLLPCGLAFGYDEIRKEIIPLIINGYHSEIIEVQSGYFIMKLMGYRGNVLYHGDYKKTWGFWPPESVFKTKEHGEEETKFTAVDLPNEVYQKALGVDEDGERIRVNEVQKEREEDEEESLENCELPLCCANISEVRDQLIRCMERKGLEKWRIDLVKDYLESSHPGFLKQGEASECPNLDKILRALGILKPV